MVFAPSLQQLTTVRVLTDWFKAGMREFPEEIAGICEQAVGSSIPAEAT